MKAFRNFTNLMAVAFLAICSISISAGTLSQLPLSLKSGVPPNIMFAMSVEFPTAITPAYSSTTYSATDTYLGYFDNAKCYTYSSTASSGSITGWFQPVGYASANSCSGSSWSGNWLNWAAMAGLDEFRYAMTGGNRVVDLNAATVPATNGLTVLQRSYQTSQGSNFPTKTWTENGTATPYTTNQALTIKNSGYGTTMQIVSGGGVAAVATCNSPTLTPNSTSPTGIQCASYNVTDGTNTYTVSCSTYSGSGTSASPYTCATFQNNLYEISPASGVPAGNPAVTVSSSKTESSLVDSTGTAGTVTLTCPANSFTASPLGSPCTATLSDSTTGTCTSFGAGPGSSAANPYTCLAFSTFSSGETFGITGSSGTSSVTDTVTGSPTVYPSSSTYFTCTYSSGPATISCPASGGFSGASCSTFSGNGSSGSPYSCAFSNWLPIGSGYTITASTGSGSVKEGTKYYYTQYRFTETSSTTSNVYYTTTYNGSYAGHSYYYNSALNVTLGGTTNTYNINVQVCNPSVGIESDCTQYVDGNGNVTWKPTGVLQANGATMRFGVVSYFDANDIDNAVLRSKAKYLAPQSYLSAGVYTPNPGAEWSATDGTLVNNPDSYDTTSTMKTPWGAAPANSGVINYLNQFGTVQQSYKTYDDIGKLYYETLRYLRGGNGLTGGKGPTTAFYNGAKSSNSDGFPVITVWDDPVQYSCQKNYIITMGDVHTWCDKRLPGGAYTSDGVSQCAAYTDGNGNSHPIDDGNGSAIGDSGITGTINGTTVTGVDTATAAIGSIEGITIAAQTMTGAGGASYYMPGLAAWAASNNIRPDLASSSSPMTVESFVIDVQESQDCAYEKHFWMTAKYGVPSNYTNGVWNTSAQWYNSIVGTSFPCASDAPPNYNTANNMQWPKNLLRAADPQSMIAAVQSAIQTIAAEQGAEAALAQSAGTLDTGTGAYIYQGAYNSGGWTGDLKAFVINQNGVVSTTPDWMASQMLPNPSARNVFSFNRATNAGINFAPDSGGGLSNFDSYQQGLLNTSNIGTVDGYGADRVKYVNGDMSNEAYLPSTTGATTSNTQSNHGWRSRVAEGVSSTHTPASYTSGPTGQLGDIVDSNPVYVGAPSAPLPDATYKTFALAHANRTPMVYVGANDGMLHALNAAYTVSSTTGLPVHTSSSGAEVFAYVPYAVYPTLNKLMSPNYAHTYYVDGPPVMADVCVQPCTASTNWETILVGGLNAGGQGIYALNITDPVAGFTSSNVLWEFTNLDDADLGYTFSQPIVAKLNNGRWAVIFGNGFDSVDPTGNPNNNKAYLFILYVDPGLSSTQKWVLNTNYFKIALTSPATITSPSPCSVTSPCSPNNASNGLAGVVGVDTNLDGTIDLVYGGDRNGNMWKIDLTSSTPSAWAPSFSGSPLFSATDGAGHAQQITTTPKVGSDPYGGYMVLFGTGSWIDTTDPDPQSGSTFYTDTLYGIWDQNTGATASPVTGRGVLQRQATIAAYYVDNTTGLACTLSPMTCSSSYTTYTIDSACVPNYTTANTAANAWTGNSLCPQYVPNAPGYTTYSSTTLGSPSGTSEQFGWYFDLPGNGERSFSNPPSLNGTNIQFMSLTPSTNPCTGNTLGFQYNFSYLTGGTPSPAFILAGTTSLATAGTIILPGWGTTPLTFSGQSNSAGAAQNPILFNVSNQAQAVTSILANGTAAVPAGMPTALPPDCPPGSCTSANYYIPGWGFLMNLPNGPTTSNNRSSLSCTNNSNGSMNCVAVPRTGQFGRLSWKQIN